MLALGLHRGTGARVYGCAGQSQVPNFPTRPLISPAAAKYRAGRGGQVRGRRACFGLAQVHGCTSARVYRCTGVRARRTVSSSHFPLAHLPVRLSRNTALGGRLRGNRLTWNLHSAHPTQVLRLSIYPIYSYIPFIRLSVYPLPIYSFLNLSVYSQNPLRNSVLQTPKAFEYPFFPFRLLLSPFCFPFSLSGARRILFSKCPRPECRGHFATLYIQICSKNRRTVSRVGRAFMAPAVVTVSAPTALA